MFFNIDTPPTSPIAILLWPVISVGLAVAIWYFAMRLELDERKAPWKWVALIPLALGLAIGYSAFKFFTYPGYPDIADAYMLTRKFNYSLYLAAVLPVLGLLSMVGMSIYERMNRVDRF